MPGARARAMAGRRVKTKEDGGVTVKQVARARWKTAGTKVKISNRFMLAGKGELKKAPPTTALSLGGLSSKKSAKARMMGGHRKTTVHQPPQEISQAKSRWKLAAKKIATSNSIAWEAESANGARMTPAARSLHRSAKSRAMAGRSRAGSKAVQQQVFSIHPTTSSAEPGTVSHGVWDSPKSAPTKSPEASPQKQTSTTPLAPSSSGPVHVSDEKPSQTAPPEKKKKSSMCAIM